MNERLLEINEEGLPECACCIYPEYQGECNECQMHVDVAVKLCEYEQAEDDGLLVRLPCKVGDTVYWISKRFKVARIISGTVKTIKISSFGYDLEIFNSCGIIKREYEKVFSTREEAERALKEAQENA